MRDSWYERSEGRHEKDAALRKAFKGLAHPTRQWNDTPVTKYVIHTEDGEQKLVEAPTASAALALSGVKKAVKIERYILAYTLQAHEQDMTEAMNVVPRPVLDVITEDSPLVNHNMLESLVETSEQLEVENERRMLMKSLEMQALEEDSHKSIPTKIGAKPTPVTPASANLARKADQDAGDEEEVNLQDLIGGSHEPEAEKDADEFMPNVASSDETATDNDSEEDTPLSLKAILGGSDDEEEPQAQEEAKEVADETATPTS